VDADGHTGQADHLLSQVAVFEDQRDVAHLLLQPGKPALLSPPRHRHDGQCRVATLCKEEQPEGQARGHAVSIGELIAGRRAALGLTQRELADAMNAWAGRDTLTRHEISRWERGDVTPRAWLVALGAVLDVPVAQLRLAARSANSHPSDPVRIAHEWLVTDPPHVTARAFGRRIGTALVTQLQARAAELRRLDDHLAGGDTHRLVTRELATTIELINEAAYTEHTGRALFTVAAELAQLAGWVSSDAGLHRQAADLYLHGVRMATEAGDQAVAANNLSSLAYQTANVGDPADAVLIACSAAAGAADAPPRVRALLAERVAWAQARANQATPAERALDQVDELLGDDSPAEPPDWVYWLDRREADVMAGRCYTELRRPLRAVPLLERTTGAYRTDARRELALYLSWLAIAYADARELDEACRVARQMAELTHHMASARTRQRLQRAIARLQEFGDVPQIRELVNACSDS
jgi:transcriptional regulator with XRE-family HTH domain